VLPHERRVQIGLLTPEEGVARGLQQQCIAVLPLRLSFDSTAVPATTMALGDAMSAARTN
jgi:hypothetical protein